VSEAVRKLYPHTESIENIVSERLDPFFECEFTASYNDKENSLSAVFILEGIGKFYLVKTDVVDLAAEAYELAGLANTKIEHLNVQMMNMVHMAFSNYQDKSEPLPTGYTSHFVPEDAEIGIPQTVGSA
jgi:hypothetical protein